MVNVRFGSLAAATAEICGVRFAPESGHEGGKSARPLWGTNAEMSLRVALSVRPTGQSIFIECFRVKSFESYSERVTRQKRERKRWIL